MIIKSIADLLSAAQIKTQLIISLRSSHTAYKYIEWKIDNLRSYFSFGMKIINNRFLSTKSVVFRAITSHGPSRARNHSQKCTRLSDLLPVWQARAIDWADVTRASAQPIARRVRLDFIEFCASCCIFSHIKHVWRARKDFWLWNSLI